MSDFLLEIGTEEIPDWMIPGALESLQSLVSQTLVCEGAEAPAIQADATCRRLVLRASPSSLQAALTAQAAQPLSEAAPPLS